MSGTIYSGSEANQEEEVDQQGSALPGFVAYIILFFQLIATTVDLLLAGWVVYTIKTTRRLHKPQNIFVANLLISGAASILFLCLISVSMIISFQLGLDSFISCFMLKVPFFTAQVNGMAFVTIAADKVIGITLSLRYKRIMTPCVVVAIISSIWLLPLIPTGISIISKADGVFKVPEFGVCIFEGAAFTEYFFTSVMPLVVDYILAIGLNCYLSIIACKVHAKIKRETKLSGVDSQSESSIALKRKLHNLRQNLKPVITLLVVIFGNIVMMMVLSVLHTLGKNSSDFYQELVEYIVIPNVDIC